LETAVVSRPEAAHEFLQYKRTATGEPCHSYRSLIAELATLTDRDELGSLAKLTYNEFDVPATQPDGPGVDPADTRWWKVDAIIDHTPPAEHVVVTDDDLTRTSRQQIRTVFDDALLITPMPSPGLSDEHLARIDDYLTTAHTAPSGRADRAPRP
jgi:hypothetical protein